MSGRQIENIYPHIASNPGEVVLDIKNLSTDNGVRNASITVRRGEVVGLAGLVGCGKSELLRAAYGLGKVTQGKIQLKGKDHTHCSTADSLDSGYFYLPPDRKHEGLLLGFSSASNITLATLKDACNRRGGWLRKKDLKAMAARAGEQVELASHNLSKTVELLSGGNQQKVLFAKGLTRGMDLYVFDEPTVGVDVGTRSALYGVIKQLCEAGAAVVVVSSDLPEVLHLSHRAYVMCHGQIAGELCGADITESGLLNLFFESEEPIHE